MIRKRSKIGLSVVLATYKEAPNLKILLPRLTRSLKSFEVRSEIIIVDDNSHDGTDQLSAKYHSKTLPIRLITRRKDRGFASAILKGTQLARGKHVIRLDADLAHQVKDVKRLWKYYSKSVQPLIIVGSRFQPKSVYLGKPPLYRMLGFWGRLVTKLVVGLKADDSTSNLRIFPKYWWSVIKPSLKPDHHLILVEELLLWQRRGLPIIESPITFHERRFGQVRWRFWKELKKFFRSLWILKASL